MGTTERVELGNYRLVAELARGGMGVVYLAHVQGPGGFQKMVVVKQLKMELAEDPRFREMFLEEANLAARLNHRNIVQTNEVSHEGGRYFMAMDYLEGCSLHTAHRQLKGAKEARTEEMGPLASFQPQFQCGCYFDFKTNGATTCKACNGPADCAAATPACNFGYCEAR